MKKEKFIVTDEILDELAMNILNTDRCVSDLASEFDTDDITILGMISLLKQKGVNIYKEKTKDDIIVTSFGDGKLGSRYPYVITNDSRELKILVLSDTWYGSIFSQPSIVSDVYNRLISGRIIWDVIWPFIWEIFLLEDILKMMKREEVQFLHMVFMRKVKWLSIVTHM